MREASTTPEDAATRASQTSRRSGLVSMGEAFRAIPDHWAGRRDELRGVVHRLHNPNPGEPQAYPLGTLSTAGAKRRSRALGPSEVTLATEPPTLGEE